MIPTQQQFNRTYDIYRSMVDTVNEIDMNRFSKYQQMMTDGFSENNIKEAIRLDIAHDKGRMFPLVFRDTNGNVVTNYKGEVVHYPAGFDIQDMLQQAKALPSKTLSAS